MVFGWRLGSGLGLLFFEFAIPLSMREFKQLYQDGLSSKQYVIMTFCTLRQTLSHIKCLSIYSARQICPITNRDIKNRTRECLGKVNREIRSDLGINNLGPGTLPKRTDLFCMSVIAIIGASSISIAGIYITQPDFISKRDQ
jgi:hypothetical protein